MHTGRVPVEHRFFGLDRRTLPFALVAVLVWFVWTVLAPWIDDRVAWKDTIQPGERIALTDDVSFAPPAGWGLQSGLRTTDATKSGQRSTPSVVLTDGGISFYSLQGPWRGSPRALLKQIVKITTTTSGGKGIELSNRPVTFQTATGQDGVLESFRSQRVEGLLAAFVFGGQGVQVQIVGPPDQLENHAQEIGRMISSIEQDGVGR